MRAPLPVFLALFLLVPSAHAEAPGQDDNATGADAPDDATHAIAIPFADIAGTLDPANGDHADWYAFNVTPGKVLQWTYHTTIPRSYVYILDDAGRTITAHDMWNWDSVFGGPANATFYPVNTLLGNVTHVRLGIAEHDGGGDYWMELALLDPADVSLDTLTVAPAAGPTDPQAPTSLHHTILVNLSNQDQGATVARVHVTVIATATGGTRDLGTQAVGLNGGQRAVLTYDWNGLGEAGEMRIDATATSSWIETRSDNNAITTTSSVLVNHTGFGLDVLNGGAGNSLLGVGWSSNGHSSVGVCAGLVVTGACEGATDPIQPGISPTGDAEGDKLAISGTGHAHSDSGLAVSGTGDSDGPVAVSGTGTSNGSLVAAGATGTSNGWALAVNPLGNATCTVGFLCIAATATGEANGWLPLGVTGTCNGGPCNDVETTQNAQANSIAVSGTGQSQAPIATSGTGPSTGNFATSLTGPAEGNDTALSGTGDATTTWNALSLAASGMGNATGGSALAPVGNARCFGLDCAAVSLTGDADASCDAALVEECVAISGTGQAHCESGNAGDQCTAVRIADLIPSPDVAISPTGDANGGDLAISGTGNAHTDHGTSLSGTGNASNGGDQDDSCAHPGAVSCIALSAAGDASNGGNGARACETQSSASVGCVALSGAGRSTNGGDGEESCLTNGVLTDDINLNCIAISLLGDASNGGDGTYSCATVLAANPNCIAISAFGTARNGGEGGGSCEVILGIGSTTCTAASLTGNASNGGDGAGSCAQGLGYASLSCVAISVIGDASNGGAGQESCESSVETASVNCVAISPAGRAANAGGGPLACRQFDATASANCIMVGSPAPPASHGFLQGGEERESGSNFMRTVVAWLIHAISSR